MVDGPCHPLTINSQNRLSMKNWRTSLAGLLAIGFGAWFMVKGNYDYAASIAIIGFGLLAGKDALNKHP